MDKALAETKRALELDPVSFTSNMFLAADYYCSRDYDHAIEQALRMIEVEPNQPDLHDWLASSYAMKGEYEKAAAEFEKELILQGKDDQAEDLRRAYSDDGFRGLLKVQIQLWSNPTITDDYDPGGVAGNYSFLGDRENAFLWLNKAYTDNEKVSGGNLLTVQLDPRLDNIRSDLRYKAFLRRMGFPQ
jgi:tetratricopeptide (TPR) repeat protein